MPVIKDFSAQDSPVKRELSRVEKASLPALNGRALIFPASPYTEVEELVDAGMACSNIICIDRDLRVVKGLQQHYYDACVILHDEASDFIDRSTQHGQFVYAHIDPCGCFGTDLCEIINKLPRLLAPMARVRITAADSRRNPTNRSQEQQITEDILFNMCEVGYNYNSATPTHRSLWTRRYAALEHVDTSHALVSALLTSIVFGSIDSVVNKLAEGKIPAAAGTHTIGRLNRFRYKEDSTPNYMTTVWVDLRPFSPTARRTSDEWVLNYAGKVIDACLGIAPIYDPGMVERPF